ncbi:MAG: metal ABC transporter permease [Melioribacteraceae bacterium]|nr:metal ABC transporter permease [Melioribacteraceae bacterium]
MSGRFDSAWCPSQSFRSPSSLIRENMIEILQYDFMVNAIIASLLASVACGIIGTYIVIKRLVFLSGGIAHSAYGGIGLGYLLSFNPIFGAVGSSILGAVFISKMRKNKSENEDTLIGIIWAFGMALGVLFIGLAPGYAPDLMSYLFGNILTVSKTEILFMAVADIIIIVTVTLFYKQFQAITFDEEYSKTAGLNVDLFYLILFVLIAVTIVLLIKLVGIILVVALLTIPAAISKFFATSLIKMMLYSILFGVTFTMVGLLFSYYLNLASGSAIIILSVFGYFVAYGINNFINK